MKSLIYCISSVILICLLWIGCSDDADSLQVAKVRVDIDLSVKEKEVSKHVNDFSFDLIRTFAQRVNTSDNQNYVISPLSMSYVLGMLLNGADGATCQQIQKMMGFEDLQADAVNQYLQTMDVALHDIDNTVLFCNANSIWSRNGIDLIPDFVKLNKTYFNAVQKENVPFNQQTVNEINQWSKEQTKGMIPEFVRQDEMDDLKMLVLNAIYFQGKWKKSFETANTKEQAFMLATGSTKRVPMMYMTADLRAVSTDYAILVELPYGNEAYRMDLLIPKDKATSINKLLENLTAEQWKGWKQNQKLYNVTISLPKFDISYEEKGFKKDLQQLGMVDAFSMNADFSKMSDLSELYISWIKQRVVIHVDESGTKAAATTGGGLLDTALPNEELKVNFDRPFAFFITEKSTDVVLFAGKLGDPMIQ